PQQIELNFRSSSTSDPFLRLEQYKSHVTQSEGEYLLNERGVEIRENVLKEFERTVYRKPYPIKTDDRNILKLNYIWTDKKEALQPVYKYTRGVIDAITLDVKLKFNFLGIGMIEFDVEFSFNRFDRVIHTATTPSQSLPPASLNPGQRSIKFTVRFDELEFVLSFESDGTRYNLKTGDSSGNEMFFFKNQNSEIKSGKVYLYPRIDYIPINEITSEENLIKIADQKKESSSIISGAQSQSFAQEYNTYFDGFSDFFVSDGTDQFAEGNNDYKVQQLDMVAKLTTPGITDTNEGHNLNPEQIQMLWDKVSLSIDDLLDHTTQRHVSTQIDYSQSFGNYFYELFFHIPMRIADHLNAAGKYREANQWYGYIYNPTAIKDKFEQLAFPNDVNWRFAAFRNIGIQKLQEIYSDPNAIEMYQRNPGNPHAIARLRIGAYQKNVVMKYLDNLMDWADYLFEQYTPESTSEARHLYNIVKSILGDKPDKVGECKDTRVLTYSDIDINENSEFIYNLFTVSRDSSAKPGYYDFESQKRRMSSSSFRVLENSSYQVKSNLKSSEKISYPTDKASDRTKGMQDILKHTGIHKVKGDQKPDKAQGRPETPQVYINTEVDLIFCFPHNKDFIQYWDRVNDRIIKLNNCLDINGVKKEMPAFSPEIDPALLARMVAGGMSFDEILATISGQLPNYRFSYLIEKAKQFCGTVQSFGGALFTAIEKRDGEELTLLRSRHEQNIMLLTTKNKKKQLEQAQTNQASLLENKTNIEQRKTYYEELIEEGLIEWEDVEQVAKWTAGSIRITEGVLQLLSAAFFLIPQLGSPFAMKYGGQELGSAANGFSNALAATAKIADNVAILAGLEGSHQRREQGWQFQLDTATQELKGMAEQLRASEISVAMAEFDLEIHNTNIEQYKELDEFYTNKFSNHQHYTFQVNELQKLYRMAFNLANDLAMQAQQAFEFERYGTTFNTGFIQSDNWNNGKAGLLSGERLMTQLLQLEKEYLDTDKRKMEITQHFSMLQITPDKLLELKTTGECADFSIPEAAFDLLYPGFFRRIIKSVRITIPCVVGPYTNIGATLSLGTNKIRTDKDSALIDFNFNGCAMIATSNAQNDAGQFELNFRDERYLPFEGAGAVSSWTLSLPKAKQAFDYNTISDVIFHISYAADYDGVYKDTVETNLITELNSINSTGFIRAFSLQHDFPNEWSVLNQGTNNADVILQLKKEHFPYFTNIEEIAGIEPNCYTIGPSNKLEEKSGNEGISKENKMEIKIPKEVGDNDYKDIIFFAKYLVN
ncbi:MAG: hypothetical protein GY931_13460, partial [Maribacter sp.]|nr:hypothetical protein [Maribacter sp.]